MSTNHTEICVILDRSGSMEATAKDHVGGLKSFVEDQKTAPGEARFTLVQFDSQNPFELMYDGVPIEKVAHIELIPRGGTPLLDAVGMTLAHLDKRLKDHEGPVIIMIVTDGEENQSHEWTRDRIKKRIAEVENQGWKVLYLGANVDAFHESRGLGLGSHTTSGYTGQTVNAMYSMTSDKMTGTRAIWESGTKDRNENTLATANMDFAPEEQAKLSETPKSKSQAKRLRVQKGDK